MKTAAEFWKNTHILKNGCIQRKSKSSVKNYRHCLWNGKPSYAHRVSYILANGPIPTGLVICHKCNNPECVNPKHLYAGTQKDNVADQIKRWNQPRQTKRGK